MDRRRLPTRWGVRSILLLATPLLFAACAKDSPTKPDTYTLTGRVRLVGTLRADTGDSIGVQLVENADGVRVYPYLGSTLGREGRFRKPGSGRALLVPFQDGVGLPLQARGQNVGPSGGRAPRCRCGAVDLPSCRSVAP